MVSMHTATASQVVAIARHYSIKRDSAEKLCVSGHYMLSHREGLVARRDGESIIVDRVNSVGHLLESIVV